MKKTLNHQESLAIINGMIDQAQNNFQKGSANTTIVTGVSVAVIAICNFILLYILTPFTNSYWIWLLMIPVSTVTTMIGNKKRKDALAKSHIDTIVSRTWNAFGWCVSVLLIIIFTLAFWLKEYSVLLMITPVILILTSLAQFITGVACRYKPYIYSAAIFVVGAIICVPLFVIDQRYQFILLAVCYLLGFVVPGYMLNNKAKKHV